jgi:hypothetical protein
MFLGIAANASAKGDTKLKLYYFHATVRCETCLKIEEFTKNAVNRYFDKELKSGKLEMLSLDFLEKKNEKLAKKYKVESQELILSVQKNGKEIKKINLDKIWEEIADVEKFQTYIKNQIQKYL